MELIIRKEHKLSVPLKQFHFDPAGLPSFPTFTFMYSQIDEILDFVMIF